MSNAKDISNSNLYLIIPIVDELGRTKHYDRYLGYLAASLFFGRPSFWQLGSARSCHAKNSSSENIGQSFFMKFVDRTRETM